MRWMKKVCLRLRSLLKRSEVEEEIDEELRYHLQRQTDEFVAKGMEPNDARYAALRAMGGIDQHKEQCRDTLGCDLSTTCGRMSAMRYACCDARRVLPESPSPRLRWGSERAPRSSPSLTQCFFDH
jgi:hypothetical protein